MIRKSKRNYRDRGMIKRLKKSFKKAADLVLKMLKNK